MEKNSAYLLERVFLEYKSKIYGYITSKSVPFSDRDDVFSQVMLKATQQAENLDSAKATLPTWVYMITRSVVIDYFRKRKKEHMLTELQPPDFYFDGRVDIEVELSELAGQLARLPERDRRIIVMRLYNDMEYSEIAMAMNISAPNARKIYSRALKKLSTLMAYESL